MEPIGFIIGAAAVAFLIWLLWMLTRRGGGGNAPGRAPDKKPPEPKAGGKKVAVPTGPGFAIAKFRSSDGMPDLSFNQSGTLIYSFDDERQLDTCIHDLKFGDDGLLGAIGEVRPVSPVNGPLTSDHSISHIRLDASGAVQTFHGVVNINPNVMLGRFDPSNRWYSTELIGHSIQFDSDDNILVTGAKGSLAGANESSIARYSPNLQIDTKFASPLGFAVVDHPSHTLETGICCTPIPVAGSDDRVVGAYDVGQSPGAFGSIVELSGAGIPDVNSYRSKFELARPNFSITPTAITRDNLGRVIVGGVRWQPGFHGTVAAEFLIGRYLSDGSIDPGFGTNGYTVIPASPAECRIGRMITDKSNRVVIAGWIGGQKTHQQAKSHPLTAKIYRLNENGRQDMQFSPAGSVSLTVTGRTWFTSVTIDSKDRIVVGGGDGPLSYSDKNTQMKMVVARFLDNGTQDPTFPPRLSDFAADVDTSSAVVIVDKEDDVYLGGGAWPLKDRK